MNEMAVSTAMSTVQLGLLKFSLFIIRIDLSVASKSFW